MNTTIKFTLPTLLLVGATVLVWPGGQAVAQGTSAGALEEITVTARRREESLMDTPVSITAFSAQDIQDRQIFRSHQLAESTPNLHYRTQVEGTSHASLVFIRGVGQSDFIPSVQPGVGIYVDEGYVATSTGSLTEILDIESIEVLRGPQGTLFGRNTIGGAIVITSKKPDDVFAGDVEAIIGERNLRQAKASINIPLSDTFFAKISALYRAKDGWVETPLIPDDDELGSEEITSGRLALRWMPSDSLTVDWNVFATHRESDGTPRIVVNYVPTANQVGPWNNVVVPTLNAVAGTTLGPVTDELYAVGEGSYTNFATYHLRSDADVVSSALTIAWDITDNMQLKSITNWRTLESIDGFDDDSSPELLTHRIDLFDGDQFSQEFQLSGTAFDGRMNWVGGLYHFEEETENINPVIFAFFGIISGSHVDNKSDAAFGQFTYDFTDQFALTLGARYTDERLDSIVDDRIQYLSELFDQSCQGPCPGINPALTNAEYDFHGRKGGFEGFPGYRAIPAPPNAGAFNVMPNRVFDADNDDIEPYLNLAYQWNDALMTYVSYSEGFKGGGFTQRIPPGRVVQSFFPEKAHVYELGAKYESLDNRFRLTGAVFYNDYTDLQVAVSTELGGGLENASDAEIKGFELEAVAAVSESFTLSGGIGYLDGEYKDIDPAVTFDPNNEMPSISEWQLNASAVYTTNVGDGALRARLDWSYSSEYYTDANNFNITPSYDVWNGSITYVPGSGNWEVSLQARNLTDEWYTVNRLGNPESIGIMSAAVAPPRELALRFKYYFGGDQ